MDTITPRQVPFSAVIMLTSVVAVCTAYFIWSLWIRADFGLSPWANWSEISWQVAEVDSRGRLVRLGSHPMAIAALIGAVTVCCVAFAFGAWQFLTGNEVQRKKENDEASSHIKKVGQELDDEVFNLLGLLKHYTESSSSHSEALAKVNKTLPSLTTADQVRAVVQRLISENSRVRGEVDVLNARLQQSQSQIEKLRVSLSESQNLGMLDAVTHLKNRHWLEANLPREVKLASEHNESLCLIMADVDHFKNINDTFGHAVGDEILRRFGELLSKNIKGRDTAVRYGGEEFVVVLPHTQIDGADNLGEQIRNELQSKRWMHHKTGKPIGTVTASFGIARLRPDDNPDTLLERADAKLYEAKAAGRNCVKSESN
jgi:diguanylate cyclase